MEIGARGGRNLPFTIYIGKYFPHLRTQATGAPKTYAAVVIPDGGHRPGAPAPLLRHHIGIRTRRRHPVLQEVRNVLRPGKPLHQRCHCRNDDCAGPLGCLASGDPRPGLGADRPPPADRLLAVLGWRPIIAAGRGGLSKCAYGFGSKIDHGRDPGGFPCYRGSVRLAGRDCSGHPPDAAPQERTNAGPFSASL